MKVLLKFLFIWLATCLVLGLIVWGMAQICSSQELQLVAAVMVPLVSLLIALSLLQRMSVEQDAS